MLSGWFAGGGVGVSQPAGPGEFGGTDPLESPAGLVFDTMVVAAERCKVAGNSRAALSPCFDVIEVALSGWDAASREHTRSLLGLSSTLLIGIRPTPS